MLSEPRDLLTEVQILTLERDELLKKYSEANDIVEAIKKGKIDAILVADEQKTKILTEKKSDFSYRRFIENMSEGVVTLNTSGVILFSNMSFAKIVNLPLEKVLGTNFDSYIPVEYKKTFNQFIKGDSEQNSQIEIAFLVPGRIGVYLVLSLNKLQFIDAVVLNIVCTDVTEQRLAKGKLNLLNDNLKKAIESRIVSEKKIIQLNDRLKANIEMLESANNDLSKFTHIASHDLQEPLRKIMTYSAMLIRDYYDIIHPEQQSYINSIQNASKRMKDLINKIDDYSDIVDRDLLFDQTNIRLIIDEILSNLGDEIIESNATVNMEGEPVEIEANTMQMKQLFYNLLTNALKFKKADVPPVINIRFQKSTGKELHLLSEERINESFCVVYVRDNGIGFNPIYKSKIFSVFQKLNSSSLYKGTGMGLAICKKIVEKHNGFINAESELDEGALFIITLPEKQHQIV
jgi:PAS domain S-box-containing protein